MAHCSYDKLMDLDAELAVMRTWPLITEKSPGVFYFKRTAFLHFHIKGEERWADVREGKAWGPMIVIPPGAKAAARKAFLKEVERRYRLMA